MVRLKSRRQCPPGGFEFRQPQTGWFLQSWDFNQLCEELQKHRQANPQFKLQTNLTAIENEVDEANALRVLAIPGAEIYVDQTGGGGAMPTPKAHWPIPHSLGKSVAAVKKVAAGAALLMDWQESGQEPVSAELANARASICVNCPKNDPGHLSKYFTGSVVQMIQKKLARLHEMKLTTPNDEKLGTCAACYCNLRLKVWTPLDLILKHVTAESKSDLDPRCWILHESPAPQN